MLIAPVDPLSLLARVKSQKSSSLRNLSLFRHLSIASSMLAIKRCTPFPNVAVRRPGLPGYELRKLRNRACAYACCNRGPPRSFLSLSRSRMARASQTILSRLEPPFATTCRDRASKRLDVPAISRRRDGRGIVRWTRCGLEFPLLGIR